jgi:hypothetical protein
MRSSRDHSVRAPPDAAELTGVSEIYSRPQDSITNSLTHTQSYTQSLPPSQQVDHAVRKHHSTIDGHSRDLTGDLWRRQTEQDWSVETYRNVEIETLYLDLHANDSHRTRSFPKTSD